MNDDTPITLAEACEMYGNRFKVATLRAEHGRGKLRLFRLGRRDYTSPQYMREWIKRCQDESNHQGSTWTPDAVPGRSEMAQPSTALDSLSATVRALRNNSRPISHRSIGQTLAKTRS